MRILVTNDDGIDSIGLHKLAEAMYGKGEGAPDGAAGPDGPGAAGGAAPEGDAATDGDVIDAEFEEKSES